MNKIVLKLVFSILVTFNLSGQEKYPTGYFSSPLDIPLKLSGTFGELRAGHFHAGIDLKTGEQEGLPVYAIADGYVSRIKIQSGGYGKAIYITHPNGFVSVYAHLSRYNDLINQYVIEKHYERRSYEIDLYLDKSLFPVKQGEIIAYSGNTGRSGGPHLHFEIRSEAGQKPINPLLFGYQVVDNDAPVISYLQIYPLGNTSTVNGRSRPAGFDPTSRGNQYQINNGQPVKASGKVYFGISTIDLFYGGVNRNGVYAISLFVNDEQFYSHAMKTFSFDETRFINSLVDYRDRILNRRNMQLTYIQPNNRLSIYRDVKNRGVLEIEEGKNYRIAYRVEDFAGNVSELAFTIEGTAGPDDIKPGETPSDVVLFDYRRNNVFQNQEISLEIPGNALYDTLSFFYERLAIPKGHQNHVHKVHHKLVPLHTWCNLSITPGWMPAALRNKAVIVVVDEKNELKSAGGNWETGAVSTRIREFGNYIVTVDTVPPKITPVNISDGKSLLAQQTIQVKITDDLSGIDKFWPTLNNKWILMEYDEKNDLLIYSFDSNLNEGVNIFSIDVWDKKDNLSNYTVTLHY